MFRTRPLTGTSSFMASDSVHGSAQRKRFMKKCHGTKVKGKKSREKSKEKSQRKKSTEKKVKLQHLFYFIYHDIFPVILHLPLSESCLC